MRPVVGYFDEDESRMQLRMEQSPFGPMIYGFIMEMMAVTSWDDESATPIEAYLKQRGWRGAAVAHRRNGIYEFCG